MNPQTASKSVPAARQTNSGQVASRDNQREQSVEPTPEQLSKALWNQDHPGELPQQTALAKQIRELTLSEGTGLALSPERLKQIDVAVRKAIPLSKDLVLEKAEYNVQRDGGSTQVSLSYFDAKKGELVILSSGFKNKFSRPNDPENRKIRESKIRVSAVEIANSWEYGRRAALHLLKLDPTRTEVRQDRIVTPDTITWKFTEKLSAQEREVTFNLNTGATKLSQSEEPQNLPHAPRANNMEFKAGMIKYLSSENLLGLSKFGAKDGNGMYVLNDAKVASTKQQLAKAFNIPANYALSINTFEDGSALKTVADNKYLSGKITAANLPEPAHFIFNMTTGEFFVGSIESLRAANPISRAEVPETLQKLQR